MVQAVDGPSWEINVRFGRARDDVSRSTRPRWALVRRVGVGALILSLSAGGLAAVSLGSGGPAGASGTTPPQFQVDCNSAPVEVGGDFDCNISILNGTVGDVVALSIVSGGEGDFIDTPCQLDAGLTCFMVFDATEGPAATGDLTGNDGFHLDFEGDANLAPGTDDFFHSSTSGNNHIGVV